MSQHSKLLKRFLSKPTDFSWAELVSLLRHLGFDLIPDKSGSSGRKFIHGEKKTIINLHEPHPKKVILSCYISQIIKSLKESGFDLK